MDWFGKQLSLHLLVCLVIKLAITAAQDLGGNEVGHDGAKVGPPASLMRDRRHIQDREYVSRQ